MIWVKPLPPSHSPTSTLPDPPIFVQFLYHSWLWSYLLLNYSFDWILSFNYIIGLYFFNLINNQNQKNEEAKKRENLEKKVVQWDIETMMIIFSIMINLLILIIFFHWIFKIEDILEYIPEDQHIETCPLN